MALKDSKYYKQNSTKLGWGEESGKLDLQRIDLIKKYSKGEKILDIACGVGFYVDYLAKNGFDSWGVDFVEDFIQKAKKNKQGNFILGKAEKLPFKDNLFDTVLLFDILEHGNDIQFLKEAKRVCKERILTIVPRAVDKELADSTGIIFSHYMDKSHLREYKGEEFSDIAKKLRLKLVHIEKVQPIHNDTIFLRLFYGPLILQKIVRKIVLLILPPKKYYTEFFVVFEK